ncbi:hypothetical protein BDR04DRAFT_1164424 [Suillus decipiens]|nr:hypothetical protein BDR04DRAFT_1164424 [Suillus decipiens]
MLSPPGVSPSGASPPSQKNISPPTPMASSASSFVERHQIAQEGSSESYVTPRSHLDDADPLCNLTDIAEFRALSLMTRFQPELQLFICDRCRCAVWADHLIGHIFINHKSEVASTQRDVAVAAVQRARERLHPLESRTVRVPLPQRHLPPLPWLQPPTVGYRCRLCAYVAGTIPSIRSHGIRLHPGKTCSGRRDQAVPVQVLFSRTQYFVVHQTLRNVSPGDIFLKFYSALPAQYSDGAFIDGEAAEASDPADLSPFLTNSGWAQATKGYSIPALRAMSCAKSHGFNVSWLSMIKGLGRTYLSTICSTANIEHKLLEGLTSWRSRHRPFQVLQHAKSVASYGHYCDRLVLMTLRALDSEDVKGGQLNVPDGDSGTRSDEVAPAYGRSPDICQVEPDWRDMEFADDDEDEDSLWPEDHSVPDDDDNDDSAPIGFETLEDLAAYPIALNSEQKRSVFQPIISSSYPSLPPMQIARPLVLFTP